MPKKEPDILPFAIITTITIFVWIGFEVLNILTPHNLETIPDSVLLPLDPKLDTQTLEKLEARKNFTDSEIKSVNINQKEVQESTSSPTLSQ